MNSVLKRLVDGWLVNSSRIHLHRCNAEFAQRVAPGMLVLDAGAGMAPYRDLFVHAKYETADVQQLERAYYPSTYVCDLSSIPVEDERFDHILFNQVMEHLPDPLAVLRELHRVLQPGGSIICTCPLFYEEHEAPYDFYRYTRFAHEYLFERSGFTIESLRWLEGYFGTVGYQMESVFKRLPWRPGQCPAGWLGWLAAPVLLAFKVSAFALAGLLYRLDIHCKYTEAGMPKNYVVIAAKPAEASPSPAPAGSV